MCEAAKELHRIIGELLAVEVPKLPGDASRRKFWELMLESVGKNLPDVWQSVRESFRAEAEKAEKLKPSVSQSYEDAMALIDEIRELADQTCDAGRDFADSVSDKARSIGESVERSGSATDGQIKALQNMLDGLERWQHD
jgi:methyl-accepting chemotaxis protein